MVALQVEKFEFETWATSPVRPYVGDFKIKNGLYTLRRWEEFGGRFKGGVPYFSLELKECRKIECGTYSYTDRLNRRIVDCFDLWIEAGRPAEYFITF